jgi:hypothetical protein
MKYNEKELAALACEGGSDKEGLLYKKGGQKGQSKNQANYINTCA